MHFLIQMEGVEEYVIGGLILNNQALPSVAKKIDSKDLLSHPRIINFIIVSKFCQHLKGLKDRHI